MCNINIDSERSYVFCLFVWGLFDWHCLHFAALWLRLSAGAAEVMFWFAVMVPVSPTLASGYSHYPLASTLCPAQTLRSPIPWQLAWLLLLTADATFHELLPPHTPTHLSSPSLSSMMNKIFIFVCVFLSFTVHVHVTCLQLSEQLPLIYFHLFPVVKNLNPHQLCCAHLYHAPHISNMSELEGLFMHSLV